MASRQHFGKHGLRVRSGLLIHMFRKQRRERAELLRGDAVVHGHAHVRAELRVHIADAGEHGHGGEFPLPPGEAAPGEDVAKEMLPEERIQHRREVIHAAAHAPPGELRLDPLAVRFSVRPRRERLWLCADLIGKARGFPLIHHVHHSGHAVQSAGKSGVGVELHHELLFFIHGKSPVEPFGERAPEPIHVSFRGQRGNDGDGRFAGRERRLRRPGRAPAEKEQGDHAQKKKQFPFHTYLPYDRPFGPDAVSLLHGSRGNGQYPFPIVFHVLPAWSRPEMALLHHLVEPLHHGWVVMGEEEAVLLIEPFDLPHFFRREHEVKYVQILFHPVPVDGLGDDHHVFLQEEAQRRLRRSLAVRRADAGQHRIREEVAPALRKRRPRFVNDAIAPHDLVELFLLMEDVGLHFIHRGPDIHIVA